MIWIFLTKGRGIREPTLISEESTDEELMVYSDWLD